MYRHCFWFFILPWFHDLVIKKKTQNNRMEMDNTFKNSSNFKENKLFSIILENKLYIIAYYKIIIYSHASRGSATSYINMHG